MKSLKDAAAKAALDTAKFVTHEVRSSATDHGWDAEVSSNTNIVFDGKSFNVAIHPDHYAQAMNHEYGTEQMRPTAVLRKYDSDTDDAEQFFVDSFFKALGRKL